ncbi:hypothetical protein K435DRAFT_960608 [Dendrothele bispora CBS 962.96]|uniref:BTB domain-containing protein n=1 Tax=Dendrothele bispora (strain CBS 962.96) TaxID=1314807 RepID=A0A4S8MUJ6_DENBC|nr:hypothetical protein K435DRAFT_960608 [Dendrothele bispora CBS 962.96]
MSTTFFTSMTTTLLTINANANDTKHKHIVRSKDFWFSDGNIVLIAPTTHYPDCSSSCSTSYAFKVHRGQLARHSEIFSDLFCVPQPVIISDQEKTLFQAFEECPWVDMHDDAEDLHWFLRALYDGLYFPTPPDVSQDIFPFLSSVLRLSNKYLTPHLRMLCLTRLVTDFPCTLDGWDRREAAATYPTSMTVLEYENPLFAPIFALSQSSRQESQQTQLHPLAGQYRPRDFYPHPFLIIRLALEMGADSDCLDYELAMIMRRLLQSAFYDLSRYAPSRIAGWVLGKEKIVAHDPGVCHAVIPEECELDDTRGHSSPLKVNTSSTSTPEPISSNSFSSLQILSRILDGRETGQKFVAEWILTELVGRKPEPECIWSFTLGGSGRWVPVGAAAAAAGIRTSTGSEYAETRTSNAVTGTFTTSSAGVGQDQPQGYTSTQTQEQAHISTHEQVSMTLQPQLTPPGAYTSQTSVVPTFVMNPPPSSLPHSDSGSFIFADAVDTDVGAGYMTTTTVPTASNILGTTPNVNPNPYLNPPIFVPQSQPYPPPTAPSPSSTNSQAPQAPQASSPYPHHTSSDPPHHLSDSLSVIPPPSEFSPWGHPCAESFYFIALNLLRAVGGIAVGRDADPLFTISQAEEMLERCDFVQGGGVDDEDEDEDGEGLDDDDHDGGNALGTGAGADGATNANANTNPAGAATGIAEGIRGSQGKKKKVCALQICTPCKLSVKESCERARRKVWAEMPGWFGLK